MRKFLATLPLLLLLLTVQQAKAWNADGHQIVGAIADALLSANAKAKVASILGVDLRTAAPWLDCVKSVHRQADGSFKYVVEEAFEAPCTPFKDGRDLMEAYVGRNFVQCSYTVHRKENGHEFDEEMGCHNTYHFDDISILRDHFDRNFQGTNEHDIVAAINAAIAVLKDRPSPPPFKIATKEEALFLLAHLIGDLHQPLHVGAVYLDLQGQQVDPDVTHTIDPSTETIGGNALFDNNKNLHSAWDAPPTHFQVPQALDLLPIAQQIAKDTDQIENWSLAWASDTIKVAPRAFAGASFAKVQPSAAHPNGGWSITLPDHAAYVDARDQIKREQLAKAAARLANLLNAIWP
ncbi:S1/P1 nuclease [Bradyrhizobium acaciae]|uniref:S1/P1 nuclease n=1 Tax=Bradyrhizobium acaciae TaxID=2683706 RepID=UPI001E6124E5|nr:S1/P1 nuclease [Bradyrhizobium acaciae]MCC8977285.1 S1/P1 nuclease [Bradyrhizobium acaciae]